MWHEARKNEKKVRGIMIDFAKRAERRKAYYERLTKDPHQLIRCIGSAYKIHLDSNIAQAAESSSVMVPWRGDSTLMMDRWDVRMSMDIIPEHKSDPASLPEMDYDEQRCNYERYRVLVQNRFRKLNEDAHLQQIDIEELYPTNSSATSKEDKAKLAASKAAIGYSYDEGSSGVGTAAQAAAAAELAAIIGKKDSDDDCESTDSSEEEMLRKDAPLDFDSMTNAERAEINRIGLAFGLSQFSSMAQSEVFEKRAQRVAQKQEEEMAEAFGKMTKRERRQVRDKIRKDRASTPPSYAQRNSPTYEPYDDHRSLSRSLSRSPSPECEIQFISEFGSGGGTAATRGAATPGSSTSRHSGSSSSWSQDRRRSAPDRDRYAYSSERRSPPRYSHRSRYYDHDQRYSDNRREPPERYRRRSRSRSHERYRRPSSRSRSRSPQRKPSTSDSGVLAAAKKLISSKTDTDKPRLTPQERLKLKMQLQLNRQLKADRKKEASKASEREEARLKREDEIRELSQRFEERDRRQQEHYRSHDDYGHRSSYRRQSHSRSPPPHRSRYSPPRFSRY